ncbi:hypothetical protein [Burkholderia perseverans]|uniref:hypothetical protein n=1 Tax=Burkholderia perseverans TaxID=2615214 RepID=UPI001FEEBC21|nr:hypothetical protein [Burkholderia perseverans]
MELSIHQAAPGRFRIGESLEVACHDHRHDVLLSGSGACAVAREARKRRAARQPKPNIGESGVRRARLTAGT